MLNKIIEFSIKNKLIIGLFIIGLIGYGIYELKHLPIDAVPDITDNQVQIITVAPSLGAADVERFITFPIEQVQSNIPGLKKMRSFSRFGLSVVTIVFEDKIDIYWARQQVNERLQQVQDQIPKEFGVPILAPVTTGLGEIYQYTVRPLKGYEHKYNATELRTIQDWIVRRQLLDIKGVADVSSFGGLLKQYEVAISPEKLFANGLTINDVFIALEKNNQNAGGAYIEKGPTVLSIRSEGLVGSIDEIRNIAIKILPDGVPLQIRDVADVKIGFATRYGAISYNGNDQISGAVVMMLKGANSNEVIQNIKQRITEIQKTLPEGVIIDPFLDRTKMVNNAISTVTKNLMEGALIVIFVLVVFLGNLRAGLLVASVIPLSLLFAIIMMNRFGVSGNLMSLGALDFGLIVDGAVIIVESVLHRLAHSKKFLQVSRLSSSEMNAEVEYSSSRMMNSAVFGQIIILIVYLPILSLEGIEGKMFRPMAETVAFALIGAFILSLTYIPMMSSLVLSKNISNRENLSDRMMKWLENAYQKRLSQALNHKKLLLIIVLSLFAASIFIFSRLGGEFIPSLPEGDFAIDTRVLPGSNLNTSIEASAMASKILISKFPEVEKVVAKTGSSEIPTDPMPMEATDLMVILKSRKEWTSAKTYSELEEKMSEALKDIPGVTFGFQYPVAMRFNELISGARQDVVCKIYGENLDTLAHLANKLGNICNTVKGVNGLYIESVTGMPQIVIRYNRALIAQYGADISEINRTIKAAFAGEKSGTVYEGEKRFDLVVRVSGDKRKNLSDVQNLLVGVADHSQVPLNTLASVEIIEGPNQIQREKSQRRIIVGFNAHDRDVQTIVKELEQKVQANMKFPTAYHIEYGGAFENLEAAKSRLYIAVPVSLIMIFLLLYFAFSSMKLGLLIYSAIPLSAIGGIWALYIRGLSFSVSAGVGFIALFGVAVLNGIVLISEFKRLRADGKEDLMQVVIQGTKTRLRPVLMTAFVASLGFLPMAVSTGEGAEVQRPLATVVIGGLLIATLLTLFVLPILYLLFNRKITMRLKQSIVPIALLVVSIFSFSETKAQSPITLEQAIETAIKNNTKLKSTKLTAEYQQKLKSSAYEIPQTSLSGKYGQFNSNYNDNEYSIAQSLNFPLVYIKQRALWGEWYQNSLIQVDLNEAELKKQVSTLFYKLIMLDEKRKILLHTDSLYQAFLIKATKRYTSGESNILEKTTAETQRGQIAVQLQQLEADLEIVQVQFQLLLNSDSQYKPVAESKIFTYVPQSDSIALLNHPRFKLFKQELNIAAAYTAWQRATLLPELNFSFNSMTLRNMDIENKPLNTRPRFNYVQAGIGLPIFWGSVHAKISASKVRQQIADINLDTEAKLLKTQYQIAWISYHTHLQHVMYYQNTALPAAATMIEVADKQFTNGEISYLDWVLLINNATTIQSNYTNALQALNDAIIELNYLNNSSKF